MASFTMRENIETNERIYEVRLPLAELAAARLSRFDQLLLAECDRSTQVSDKVLGLETLVRRAEEARK